MTGVYPQMPYEEVDEATYQKMLVDFKQPDFRRSEAPQEAYPERFCDSDVCTIDEVAAPKSSSSSSSSDNDKSS
jgi:hypothetical protein